MLYIKHKSIWTPVIGERSREGSGRLVRVLRKNKVEDVPVEGTTFYKKDGRKYIQVTN